MDTDEQSVEATEEQEFPGHELCAHTRDIYHCDSA
jgi:hypothetical protein